MFSSSNLILMGILRIWFWCIFFLYDSLSFNVDFEHAVTFSGPQNSLFGYNSALLNNRFVVTAPRGNQTSHPDLISPGTIYICPVNFDNKNGPSCEQLPVRSPDLPRFQKNQFLGGSLVKINAGILVCAHLTKYPNTDIIFEIVSGRCYLITHDLSRVNTGWTFPSSSFAMAGFSSAPAKDGSYSILGAPGMRDLERGGYLKFDTNAITEFKAQDFFNINSFLHMSYIGYSVAVGQFPILGSCTKSPILLGTPRFYNVEGHVGSVLLVCETSLSGIVLKQFYGDQIGSGFGYSILACDYNGDNIDDLIVGAPFYEPNKQSTDGGKVYVFLGTDNSDYIELTNATLNADIVLFGRFGTAMACLGDINADQLNDLAISAPYEGNGVVYIYNGKRDMINMIYSQKIYGRSIDPGIRTFGLHISQQPTDVDDNRYSDFTVGSALSNKLTVLRTRPVVSITPLVTIHNPVIPLNSSGLGCEDTQLITPCTTMIICFSFNEHLNGKVNVVDMRYQLNIDVDRIRRQSRVHIVHNSTIYRNTFVQRKYSLLKRQTHCEFLFLRVTSFDRQFFASLDEPLKVTMNYSLNDVSGGMEILPVLNPASNTAVEQTVRFQTGCEGTCVPDLQTDMQLEPSVIIFGQSKELKLTITLTNSGEPALAPYVRVVTSHTTPSFAQTTHLQEGSVLVICTQQPDNITVSCDCGNVLYHNQLAKFTLTYDVDSILPSDMNITDIMDIVVYVQASVPGGHDGNPGDNSVRSVVPVQLHSRADLTGNSVPDQATISDDRIVLSLEHSYEIYNIGPSPMIGASISVQLPPSVGNLIILEYNSVQVSTDKNTTSCDVILRNQSTSDMTSVTGSPTTPLSLMEKDVTCSSNCTIIQCRVQDVDVNDYATVDISFDIYTRNLDFSGVSSLNYISKGFVSPVSTDLPFQLLNNGTAEATTVFYPAPTTEPVEPINLWIVVGGSVGGIVLLVILFAVMWKLGFFKRNKKKVVDEFKRKSNYYENRKTQIEARKSKPMLKARSDEIILQET